MGRPPSTTRAAFWLLLVQAKPKLNRHTTYGNIAPPIIQSKPGTSTLHGQELFSTQVWPSASKCLLASV